MGAEAQGLLPSAINRDELEQEALGCGTVGGERKQPAACPRNVRLAVKFPFSSYRPVNIREAMFDMALGTPRLGDRSEQSINSDRVRFGRVSAKNNHRSERDLGLS